MKKDKYTDLLTYSIVSMEQLTAAAWSMVIACPEIAEKAQPGQFVKMIKKNEEAPGRP